MDVTELKTVETTLDGASIVVGGASVTDRFVPNINCQKWDDECFLNINHPDEVTDERETTIDDKTAITIGNNTHRYYITEDGKLEYEIEFQSRPLSNIVTLNLTFSEGLRFCYQDSLYNEWWLYDTTEYTWEEYERKFHRPENVEGSYAVYWRRGNNQYQTGKFCHIFRPKLIDAEGAEIWAELHIDPVSKIMTITMDGEWLDHAAYPVILDPTLGYSTAGASDAGDNNYVEGWTDITDGTGGAINSYHCAVASIGVGAEGVKMAVFNADQDTGSPAAKTIVETYVEWDVAVSDDEDTAGGSTSLSADTKYFICFIPESDSTDLKYDTDAEIEGYYKGSRTYGNEIASPFDAGPSSSTRKYSIWIDYGGAAGGENEEILRIRRAHYNRQLRMAS